MRQAIQLSGLLLACVVAGVADDQKNAAANGGGGRHPAAARALPREGGNPRRPKQTMGPPLSNPASPAARLYRASPEERERALEKLPPRLQEQLRTQLARFDAMPKPQQEILIHRAERYAALSPEQQTAVRQQMIALRDLSQERRAAVAVALRRLQSMSEDERLKTINSEEFNRRFSAEEQKIIADLSEVMIPPM